jgi:hypothetical protein
MKPGVLQKFARYLGRKTMMKEYRTAGIVTISGGKIGLTPAQAGKRATFVEETKEKGVYIVLKPVTFKAGELVRLDQVSKAQASLFIDVAAEAAAAAKAAKKAETETETDDEKTESEAKTKPEPKPPAHKGKGKK